MNRRSIRFQLLVWYGSLLIGAFALFSVFIYAALNQFLVKNLGENLSRRARQIGRSIQLQPTPLSKSWLQEEIGSRYAPESSSRFVRVTDHSGDILYISGPPHDGSFNPSLVPSIVQTPHGSPKRIELSDGTDLLIQKLTVTLGNGSINVEVGASLSQIHAALSRMLISLLIGVPVLIVVAGAGAYVLIGRALSPVAEMTRSAERVTLKNLNEKLPVAHTGDELENLSLALNKMISRINEAYEYTRRFIADASHELRTPLTILRGELENVVNNNHLSPETKETLGSNLEEVERLGKIVEGLFALSRLDAGEAHSESTQFDLAELAKTTTEQMCLLAEDKQISLRCESAERVMIKGDRARLKQVVVNLVDNAIKYTPEGGTVSVTTFQDNGKAVLQVSDNGVGIPKESLPHIFERFYRVDKGRSRDLGGAGLGLSIVTSICHAHDGEITVRSEEKGSVFQVNLPLASPESNTHICHE